jgi:acyl-CoA reductase-like NAD-dependent aldehyde dehydrogenase
MSSTDNGRFTMTVEGSPYRGLGPAISVTNPADATELARVPTLTAAQADEVVSVSRRVFDEGTWAWMDGVQRSRLLHSFADQLEEQRDELLDLVVAEVGTPVSTARGLQFDVPLAYLRWFADAAARPREQLLSPSPGGDSESRMVRHPVGVVVAIAAYNYPFLLSIWKIGAALASGCTVVLVPSPQAPLAVLRLGALGAEAGLPPGVLNVVVAGPEASRRLTEHPDVDAVTFTGSTNVGSMVMSQAAPSLKRVVLELGGKSPAIVMPGTDLGPVVQPLLERYCRNAGQGCASPTRLLVHADQIEEFSRLAVEVMDAMAVGNPRDESTLVGPLISEAHRDRVAGFVEEAVQQGGYVVAQGKTPSGAGWWYPPTVLGGLPQAARAVQEEIFGPVAVLTAYRDLDEAVRLANDTAYGLQAYVFGPDNDACVALGRRLRAGNVIVNGGGLPRMDAPFGGFKRSGNGREGGEWGLNEFVEIQHIQSNIAGAR